MSTGLVIHGHFYQPPRENPWTDFVDREPSAHPFHDWNARILAECYRPNGWARIQDGYGRVERIVNNYAHMSYNFGPTLLSWLALHDPVTYARILKADRDSMAAHGGHGNAIAQAYNHTILPLSHPQDRRTQVRWGLADFRHRFGREPEAMWLPETACNDEVLNLLIEEGMTFALLSPYQALRVRPLGDPPGEWQEVPDGAIDPGIAYRWFHRDGSGRSLALFFYDGAIARAIAFEGGLASSQALIDRLSQGRGGEGRLVQTATDGESYGHHTHFGELTLAHALTAEAGKRGFRLTNYGHYLEHHPPTMEVEIQPGPEGEGTAWSCAHGVGRWYRDCGCHTGGQEGWNQAWRTPLRDALNFLREEAARVFDEVGRSFFTDPWAVRDAYIEVVLDREHHRHGFLRTHSHHALTEEERVRALSLLEMQRHSLLMFTSCGWFFNDISGIETVQVMKYAERAMELMGEVGHTAPRNAFLEILGQARSNLPEMGSGADVYRRFVDPLRVSPQRIAAHMGISALVDAEMDEGRVAEYSYQRHDFRMEQRDRFSLATCRLLLTNRATAARHDFAVAAMHFGGVDFYSVLRPFPGRSRFHGAVNRVWEMFPAASMPALLRGLAKDFGPHEFGLEHVLPEGREHIARVVFGNLVERFAEEYARLYEDNRHSLEMLQRAGLELPTELRAAAEFTLRRRFEAEIREQQLSRDPTAYQKALEIAEQAMQQHYNLDSEQARIIFQSMITDAVTQAVTGGDEAYAQSALELVQLTQRLHLGPDLRRAQELLYETLTDGAGPLSETLRRLALALGLAPVLIHSRQPGEATPAG